MTYIYKDGDRAHPWEHKMCPQCETVQLIQKRCTYCSARCSSLAKRVRYGEEAAHWKGDNITYKQQHERVYQARGKASEHTCKCGEPARDWANLTGSYLDTSDFEAMCKLCHNRFDAQRRRSA